MSTRLEKRVLVPLPGVAARELMFRKHLAERATPGIDFQEVGCMMVFCEYLINELCAVGHQN